MLLLDSLCKLKNLEGCACRGEFGHLQQVDSLFWLNQNEIPWNHEPSIDIFKSILLTDKDREWAKAMLLRKPLAENPRLRDCTRPEYERFKTKKYFQAIEEKLDSLCPDWKTNPSYRPPLTEEQVFENDLLRIKLNPQL